MENTKLKKASLLLAATLLATNVAFAVEWNHDQFSPIGPQNWGELDPAFEECAVGTKQSPINITGGVVEGQAALVFKYQDTPLVIENNGHTIEVPYELGSGIRIGKDTYRLLQYHFHAPSEHNVDGSSFPMEAHLVHINSSGQLAVVGVTMVLGDANPVIAATFDMAPLHEGETVVDGAFVNASGLIPWFRSYTTYNGSLTTPPCSEGVRWFVMDNPITVSPEQVEQMHNFIAEFPAYEGYDQNNRPLQPLNGRILSVHPRR